MKGIRGKNVLVTGGSSGIGQAIAIRFGEEGANVAINYRKGLEEAHHTERTIQENYKPTGPDQPASVKTLLIQADVSQEADVRRMFDEVYASLGGLDILINNAGFQMSGPSHEITVDSFDRVVGTNLRGAFMAAQLALKHFVEQEKPGIIINVSSVHQEIPKPGFVAYSVSKGGMQNLTRTLALEYAGQNIRINRIAPGAIITPMNNGWIHDPVKKADVEKHIPMGRAGLSEEIAGATVFMCSDEASYITGQTLFIDGGLTLYADFATNWSSD